MFCPECGKPNPEENQLCQFCNAPLIDNSAPVAPTTPGQSTAATKNDIVINLPKVDSAKAKSFLSAKKFIIIPVVAVLVIVIAFASIGSSLFSPEKTVEAYYNALLEGDYDEMFKYTALPEGEFITAEAYTNAMKSIFEDEQMQLKNYGSFQIKEASAEYYDDYYDDFYDGGNSNKEENSSPFRYYLVEFYDRNSGNTYTDEIMLIEQESKKLLFFSDYKVSSEGLVARDASVAVSGDVQVAIDGKILENPSTDEDGYNVYTIDAIFEGDHTITLTSDLYEPYEGEVGFYGDFDKTYIDASEVMQIKADILTTLEAQALSDIVVMYTNAMGQLGFPQDALKLAPNNENVVESYNELLNNVALKEDGTGLLSITFTSAEITSSYYSDGKDYSVSVDENGNTTISFEAVLTYDYTSAHSVGWFNPQIENQTGTRNEEMRFNYVYSDGAWALSYLSHCTVRY